MQIRILKINTCPSRSGKSQLTYQLGCNEQSEVYLRIHGNSGTGFFNDEWIAVKRIQAQLSSSGNQFTSFALNALFKGKSMNTPFFILAVLFKEGLVITSTSNRRCYQLGDFD